MKKPETPAKCGTAGKWLATYAYTAEGFLRVVYQSDTELCWITVDLANQDASAVVQAAIIKMQQS